VFPADSLRTWLNILAELFYICPAGLCQDYVIPEVCHLHELVVEHLLLTGRVGDVVLLVLQGSSTNVGEKGGSVISVTSNNW
jgi:hypothetical protein